MNNKYVTYENKCLICETTKGKWHTYYDTFKTTVRFYNVNISGMQMKQKKLEWRKK